MIAAFVANYRSSILGSGKEKAAESEGRLRPAACFLLPVFRIGLQVLICNIKMRGFLAGGLHIGKNFQKGLYIGKFFYNKFHEFTQYFYHRATENTEINQNCFYISLMVNLFSDIPLVWTSSSFTWVIIFVRGHHLYLFCHVIFFKLIWLAWYSNW